MAKLKAEACSVGRTFRAIVNETLRRGLGRRRAVVQQQCFKVAARDLSNLKPRLSPDDVAELNEHVEGTLYR